MRLSKNVAFLTAFLLLTAAAPAAPAAAGIRPAVTAVAEEAPKITATGTLCETVSWQLDEEGTLFVTGSGDMSEMTGNLNSIRNRIRKAVIRSTDDRNPLTAIGASMFSDCSSMTEVSLPDTIRVINQNAFLRCSALTAINFPEGLNEIGVSAFSGSGLTDLALPGCTLGTSAFFGCPSLKTVEIDEGTEIIPANSFARCYALESVKLPNSVKSIEATSDSESGAFYYSWNLKKVSIGKGIESIHEYAFRTRGEGLEVTFRSGVKTISENAFRYRTELSKLVLPKTLTTIEANAFLGCSGLSVCEFPSSLQKIGVSAFSGSGLTDLALPGCTLGTSAFFGCPSLKTVEIDEGTETIPANSFARCYALESVKLPDSVKSIEATSDSESGAFYYCNSLKKVSIGRDIESIHQYAFRTRGEGLEITFRDGVKTIPENAFRYRTELSKVVFPNTLTTIEANAFSGCTGLSICEFPESLQRIGESAFTNTGLTEIVLPGCELGTSAFYNCSALKSVTIGEGTEVIPVNCFAHCYALESVVLPDTVKSIEATDHSESGAFYYCNSLKKVSIGRGIESIHQYAFRTRGEGLAVTFRKGVKAIPENAFRNRGELGKVVLPNTLTSVGKNAFAGCDKLSSCNFPASLECIGESAFHGTGLTEIVLPGCELGTSAFYNCGALKSVTIGEGTEVIPVNCFAHCYALESVVLPDTVKSIEATDHSESGAFYYCNSLKKVSIGRDIESIHQYAFRTRGSGLAVTFRKGVKAIPENAFRNRGELEKVVLPNTLTSVGKNAFAGCDKLSSCNFPASLERIGESAFHGTGLTEIVLPGCELGTSAFYNCSALKSVTIGEGTEVIPESCFAHCYALESVALPDSVKSIEATSHSESGAFYYCNHLKKVLIGKNTEMIHTYAFRTRGESLEVTFEDGAVSIPDHAFDYAPLTTLILPESMEEISEAAISGCSGLQLIVIPSKDCVIADSARTITSGARIRGYDGSTAQQYAEKYERVLEPIDENDPVIVYGNCVTGVSLSLEGRIGVNFYAKLNNKAAKVILESRAGRMEFSGDALDAAMQPDGSYKFTFGVSAAQANEKIILRIYDARGRQLDVYNSKFEKTSGRMVEYSVNDYIADVSKYKSNEKLNAMVGALDQFCKASQNYFFDAGHELNIKEPKVVKTNNFNKQFKIALVLNSGTALRIYSDAASAVRVRGEEQITLEAVRPDETTQYYEIPDISAFDLLKNETVILDGVTYTVCPTDYCALVLSKNDTAPKLRTVCSALYYYSVAAQAYGNSIEE